jgi:hypothetical protein
MCENYKTGKAVEKRIRKEKGRLCGAVRKKNRSTSAQGTRGSTARGREASSTPPHVLYPHVDPRKDKKEAWAKLFRRN